MASVTAKSIKRTQRFADDYLPESDGEPMAETDVHRKQMIALLEGLESYYRDGPNIYVTGNIFLYLPREEGERTALSPDIFVVKGVAKKDRRIYDLEVEKKAPDLVIELTSRSTHIEDLGNKRVIYAKLGVKEYFIFDPLLEAFTSPLRGYRLENGDYLPMMGARLHSEVLGLDLVVEEGMLRLQNPQTGERLLNHEESEAARRAAEMKAAAEAAARLEAEAARHQAEAKATAEKTARLAAEAENLRLREALARLQKQA